MKYSVLILRRAREDIEQIYDWIAMRSQIGATHWYAAFHAAVADLQWDAGQHAAAPEANALGHDVRQRLFKTRRGRSYRILFLIVDKEIRILRIRGPGQAPLQTADI